MNNADPVLALKPAGADFVEAVRVEVAVEIRDDFEHVLHDLGVKYDLQIEHSMSFVGGIVLLYGLFKANGGEQIARIIEAITHRNDGKSIRLKLGDDEIEVAGLSSGKLQKAVDDYLPKIREANLEARKQLEDSIRRNAIADGEDLDV